MHFRNWPACLDEYRKNTTYFVFYAHTCIHDKEEIYLLKNMAVSHHIHLNTWLLLNSYNIDKNSTYLLPTFWVYVKQPCIFQCVVIIIPPTGDQHLRMLLSKVHAACTVCWPCIWQGTSSSNRELSPVLVREQVWCTDYVTEQTATRTLTTSHAWITTLFLEV